MPTAKKPAEPAAADTSVLDEQLDSLARRVQALEEELAAFKQKVASNIALPDD